MNAAIRRISRWAAEDSAALNEESLRQACSYESLPAPVEARIRQCVRLANEYENKWCAVPFPNSDPWHPPFWIKRKGRTFMVSTGTKRAVGRFVRQSDSEAYANIAAAIESCIGAMAGGAA